MMDDERALMWVPVITVAKVEQAKGLLQLPDICSGNEIRSAYLKLAKKWHPDSCSANRDECDERFRRISDAWNFMRYLMEHYRYSLRYDDIIRYQESPEMQYQRRFGGGLWCGEVEDENRFLDDFMNSEIRLTAENVVYAATLLQLLELTDADGVKRQQRKMLHDCSGSADERLQSKIVNAGNFLLRLIKNYRYLLTPEAIRQDQESALAWHRRQFDSEPLWAGGFFDDAFHSNREKRKDRDGKFQGI